MALMFEIVRPPFSYIHICIPLDVCDVWIFRHKIVDNLYNIVLNFGFRQVMHELGPSSAINPVPVCRMYCPVGVFFEKFAWVVGHFRLNPYAEFDAALFGILYELSYSVRKFIFVYNPVPE